ncbi:hypothetical protein ACH5RR_034131 [Cinchona calisaya]|uniref:C3H1-type domain-containing protein n=1 Tax=Cinchona calisaya TaxID=153742 RepID=A0ABD2YAU1_9GENT
MELPPFHHQRYVPPPSNFSENPNFYQPHTHRFPPPPPLQQQPPPPPHPSLPPPPYHLSHPRPRFPPPPHPPPQSQFSFRPHIEAAPAPAPAQFHSFIPPRLLNQPRPLSPHKVPSYHHNNLHRNSTFYDDNSRFSDPWPELPPPPRAPIEPDFHYQHQRRPLSPLLPRTDSYMNGYERSVSFRGELINKGFRDNANHELPFWVERNERDFNVRDDADDNKYRYHSDRGGFGRNIDRIDRDMVTAEPPGIDALSPSRNFALNVGNYESYKDREEDLRWGYSRLEDNNEYMDGEGVSLPSHTVRRELLDDGYDDVDRLSSERVGEGVEEFFCRSPRKKQVQKKSALLRIQLGKGNNRNNNNNNNHRYRSHDNNRYSRSYYDQANLSAGGSFKGKEKDISVHPDWKMDGQREKSPVELDVSFKSNALVAKAIKTTSSPVSESDRSLVPRNKNLKKTSVADSPGTKLCDDLVKSASSTCGLDPSSVSDKEHGDLPQKITSFKTDSSAGGLDCPPSSDKHSKESAEKVISVKSDSYNSEFDFPSCSDKGPGPLAEKMSVCGSRTDAVDGNIAGEESMKLKRSHQGVKRVAPDEVLEQIARKRKTGRSALLEGAALQSVSLFCKPTNPDDLCTTSVSAGSQLDEGVTHSKYRIPSASMDARHDDLSPSPANTIENVNNASEDVVSDLKEDRVNISSGLILSSECSALISVSSNPGETGLCGGAGHADRLIHNGLSGLNSDRNLVESQNTSVISGFGDLNDANEHPCLNGPLLVENDLVLKIVASAESNNGLSSLKENKFHDSQIDTSTPNHGACTASNSDQGLCREPGDIVNTGSKEFPLDQVNVSHENDIGKDYTDPDLAVSLVGILGSSKIEEIPVCENAENQDLCSNSSSSPKCPTGCFSDSLGNRTVSGMCLLEDGIKPVITNGATTLPVTSPSERSPKPIVSYSSKIGKKRKDRDDQLDVHDSKTRKIAVTTASNLDDDDSSFSLFANNLVSAEEVVDFRNVFNTSRKDCSKEGPSVFNPPVQGGKKRRDSSLTSTSPVLYEMCQGPKDAIISYPSVDCLSNSEEGTALPEHRVALSSPHDIAFVGLTAYSEASALQLQEDSIAGESYQLLGSGAEGESSKIEHERSCPPKWEADKKDNTLVISVSDVQLTNDTHNVRGEGNFVRPDENQKQHFGDGDCENHLLRKENLASPSDDGSFCADVCGISASSSTDRQIDSVPDTLSNMGSPEDAISNMRSDSLNNESRLSHISSYEYHGKDDISKKNSVSGDDMRALSLMPSLQISKTGIKSGDAVALDLAVHRKAASLPQNTFKVTPSSNSLLKKSTLTNNRLNSSVVGDFPGNASIKYPSTTKVSPFNHIAKPRTWHRTLDSSPSVVGPKSLGNFTHPQNSSTKEIGKVQSSYVRRGNSLVRKPSPVGAAPQVLHGSRSSVHHLNSGIDNVRKARGSESKIDVVDSLGSATLGAPNSCPERPKTPPLMGNVKLLNCITPIPGDLTFLPLFDPPRGDSPCETNDPSKSAEDMDTRRSSEDDLKSSRVNVCQTGSSNDVDCQSNADERNSGKKILYVKRRSNQLVAASSPDDRSLHGVEKTQDLSSDGYYKRRKNQLIRTSLKGGKPRVFVPDKSSRQQDAQKNIQSRSYSKRQSGKGFMKKKYSLVWTLHGTMSSRKNINSGRWRRVLPYLFPWKRVTYWTNFVHSLSAIPNDSPISTIGQKLPLSRKRDAIYKRSNSGFSLRRTKVFSVGGRSLKWSKSIERNSRKVNEDATLAAVAAEKRKRAQNGAAFTLSKSRNYVSRERIFRIGSERYKMDPTKKTLQRISDEQPSLSRDQSENDGKKFYVPRRLLIGSDEYIRIGNGNQLVRDPKRRTRILANEKVRWSLHTARLRLARKKKYCQFFTRFGKCNKDDKKCPYIHDPSKIAVCTKFLNGSCSNSDCTLTHKVIPERMQDCSYFLQGLCSNESCPYRHVNVNPNSPICEGFLRGYCADGNECPKKHTYVCPVFEATGDCPKGPKCKLHHPKKKKKGMKRKASNVQKNARGRYFGARPVDVADCRAMVSGVTSGKGDENIFYEDGKFADFISLDVSIEEMEQAFELRSEPTCDVEGPSDMQVTELDELIKPVRLMNKNLTIASSPAVDSSSEMTTSYVSEESHCR